MTTGNFTPSVRHTLLIPGKFRLTIDEIAWTHVSARDVDPGQTARCLWDFIALAEATRERLPNFVRRWGLLDSTGETPAKPGEDGDQLLELWTEAALEVEQLVSAIARTEDEEMVSEQLVWDLRDGDQRTYYDDATEEIRGGRFSGAAWVERAQRKRLAHYRAERRAGRGIALQRELIAGLLGAIAVPPEWRARVRSAVPLSFVYAWDDQGRRLEARASGVREIVAAQLISMFASTKLDVFVCSVCEKPFSLETSDAQRRPRRGVKRLCSDPCRKTAKRESNRTSWNKNKDRWRPPSSGSKKVKKRRGGG